MEKEQELQQQFLLEVDENIHQLEAFFQNLSISPNLDIEEINTTMRAAHSIKGGAAIMGLPILSNFAHHWEDYLKVLKIDGKKVTIDDKLIQLCLEGIDCLRQLVAAYADNLNLTAEVIAEQFQPVFANLDEIFGEPVAEDMTTILATETNNQEAIALMFETQIELSLQQLGDWIGNNEADLGERLIEIATEFDGLGQMFEITPFSLACESVLHHLTNASNLGEVKKIAQGALSLWRECQKSVLANQWNSIPTALDLDCSWNTPTNTEEVEVLATLAKIPETNQKINIVDTLETPITSKTVIADTYLRISQQQIDTISELSREITISQNRLESQLQEIWELTRHQQQILRQLNLPTWQNPHHWQKITSSPNLPNDLQTTATAITKLKEITIDIQTHLHDVLEIERTIDRSTQHLQTRIDRISMRPLGDIFERFPPALRELCRTYQKDVKIKIQGGDILVERTIIDALNEPLTHLFRNAFDHGIETPQQRKTAGKAPQATIEITAQQQQNQTIITVSDDGKGIDLNRIRDRAIAMGLDPTLLQQASKADLLSLIFEPGFSTNDTVTELSGRGVGMDIVRNKLQQIQGQVTVHTQESMGTTFTFTLPLQTSLIRVLLIESDRTLVAIPKNSVLAIFPDTGEELYTVRNKSYYKYQDTLLPAINLANCWKFNTPRHFFPTKHKPNVDIPAILIVDSNNQTIALQVERYWQEQEVISRPIEGNIPLPAGFSNGTILRDGRIVPLLNLPELLYAISDDKSDGQNPVYDHRISQHQPALPTNQLETNTPKKPPILIVDDSVNVRRLLARRLEKNGYTILEAKNGLDALQQIHSNPAIAAIISDIDMPQLDGYGLLEKLQSHSQFTHIPIVMLTSHTSEKYRQKAFQLGATAYLNKPCNEHELIQVLGRITRNKS